MSKPSAIRVAYRFMVSSKPTLEGFLIRFHHRDALQRAQGDSNKITGPMMAEVAWEIGYEGDAYGSTLKEFEPLAKSMGVNLRAEFDKGADAR